MIVRIPVADSDGNYHLEVSNSDKTHLQRHTKKWWLNLFSSFHLKPKKYFSSNEIIWDSLGVLAVFLTREG